MAKRKKTGYRQTGKKGKTGANETLIVGIGASAGGLEAFSQLLRALPGDRGMSFVFVQHLEPSHESKLPEILSKTTSLPVNQIEHNSVIQPNQVYVIPPGKHLGIENQKLKLTERKRSDGIYMPVDFFFQSLASEQKNRAIGIILSGTATDGTLGLKAIKAKGGLTFAQSEESAKYAGMPGSAIDSGNVDVVLSPEKIAKELIRISQHPYIAFSKTSISEKETSPEKDEDALTKIFRKLRTATGVDFSNYKYNTVKRRITRRMVINKIDNIDKYVKFINEDKNEVNDLYNDLLINVTNFFRDGEVYETLKTNIFPEIVKNISPDNPVRVWVPGCSTGEEVYSIAISLLEFLEKKSAANNIQIFATDISEPSIDKARAGIYDESTVKDVPPAILKRYFVKNNSGYQINKTIRDRCVFARQDISKDPPFSRIDLISCRNLLIYLSSEMQKKIIPIFHYALKPKGYLLLGTSESIGTFADLFHLADKKYKIYEKKHVGSRTDYKFTLPGSAHDKTPLKKYKDIVPDHLDIQKQADKIILNRFSPAGILVNNNLDIVQFRGKVNQYIEPNTGDASLNLFKMIKEGLNLELHTSLRKAKNTHKPVVQENIRVKMNGSYKIIDLEVIPFQAAIHSNEFLYLILFNERDEVKPADKKGKKSLANDKSFRKDDEKDGQIEKLRKELLVTKEHLQSIIEEREATNEELRSALEELQSSNEELQSTNEEMETAREELQSTNEELITVNDELENRNNVLNEINNDLNNLISSVHIPIIMLGSDLKIRRFTPKAGKIWNLIPGDIGRPIGNIKPNIEVPNLKEKILEVLDNLEIKEIEVKDNLQNWYAMKIRPYRTVENKIDGVVISLVDIDVMKRGFDAAIDNEDFIDTVFNLVTEPIIILDNELKIKEANKSFFSKFKLDKNESIGKSIYTLGNGEWNNPELKKLLEKTLPQNKELKNYEVVIKSNGKESKKIKVNARRFVSGEKDTGFILMAITQ